jgi:hypothetical protein
MRFLCQVSSTGSFLRFHRRLLCSIALNHPVALHRPAARAGRAPYHFRSRGTRDPTDAAAARHSLAYDRFTVLLAVPFSFQFCGWELG